MLLKIHRAKVMNNLHDDKYYLHFITKENP